MGSGTYAAPTSIVKQWMASPPHRAMILTAGFKRIGLGLASGTYQGTTGTSWPPPTSPPEAQLPERRASIE